jgi:hypothetical protein
MHLRTACTNSQMENQSSVPGGGKKRSSVSDVMPITKGKAVKKHSVQFSLRSMFMCCIVGAVTAIRHLMTFRRKMFARAAIGPAVPIATPMLLVASHMSHPIPEPALALRMAAIASERTNGLSFDSCSMITLPYFLKVNGLLHINAPFLQSLVSGIPHGVGAFSSVAAVY